MDDQRDIIDKLSAAHPWPENKPDLPFSESGWFPACNQDLLRRFIGENSKVIVEMGAWVGLSTRWIADNAPGAKVITIDHWKGSPENSSDPLVPILYEQFTSNCWGHKDRIIPVRSTTTQGIEELRKLGVRPDVIYVDAGHDYDSVCQDLKICMEFDCPLVGDDFNPNSWPGVVQAVWEEANNWHRELRVKGSAWALTKE